MVKEAIELIWKAFDKEKASKGYRLLRQAAEGGDADAYCFLGRCHLGEEFVWDGAGFHVDEALASVYLKESVRRGSSHGVLCALRTQDLTPSVAREMPFASTKEAFLNVVRQADSGDAFSRYVVGNVMFWGDFLTIEGEKEADKYETEEDYDSYAYPIAAKYYEMSFDGGLGAAFGNYRTIYESGLADIDDDTYESYLKALSDIGNPLACRTTANCWKTCMTMPKVLSAIILWHLKEAISSRHITLAYAMVAAMVWMLIRMRHSGTIWLRPRQAMPMRSSR